MVNLMNIAARHWIEYQRGDLDALAEVMQETVKECLAEIDDPQTKAKVLARIRGD